MSLYISTNQGAVTANYHLGRNSNALQKSMQRLASGSRINRPSDDAGGLAVSMKLEAAINRLAGAEKNIQNGISFLEVQDGILESIGTIVDRMSELKGLSRDVMKNESDQKTYNREFKDLQVQLKDMISGTFNGVSLFARYADDNSGGGVVRTDGREAIFDIDGKYPGHDHTVDVFTSAEGSAGAKVSIHKALAWSALTFDSSKVDSRTTGVRQLNYGAAYEASKTTDDELGIDVGNTVSNVSAASLANEQVMGETTQLTFTLAAQSLDSAINLHNVSVGVFLAGMENIAALRAQNGAAMSRLEFQQINLSRQRTNMEAANGRIKDVDMGAETTRMAKYSVLRQASAAMLAQANSAPEVALMLLR
ncbi:flagellin [Opitutales bacterium]|nr:flagellin [Opitutales bacterium]